MQGLFVHRMIFAWFFSFSRLLCVLTLRSTIPVSDPCVQRSFDFPIGDPDSFRFNHLIDMLVQLLLGAVYRQLPSLPHEAVVFPSGGFHDPGLLFLLQMTPLLVCLKQLTVNAYVILHNFCSKSSISLKKRSM